MATIDKLASNLVFGEGPHDLQWTTMGLSGSSISPSLLTAGERQHFAQHTTVFLASTDWSKGGHLTRQGQSEPFFGIHGFGG